MKGYLNGCLLHDDGGLAYGRRGVDMNVQPMNAQTALQRLGERAIVQMLRGGGNFWGSKILGDLPRMIKG